MDGLAKSIGKRSLAGLRGCFEKAAGIVFFHPWRLEIHIMTSKRFYLTKLEIERRLRRQWPFGRVLFLDGFQLVAMQFDAPVAGVAKGYGGNK